MRKELFASKRLDKHLLGLLRRQVDFDRIYLDHSASNTAHPRDLGEDCDYTRITSERLIQLSLLESDPKIRIHYLHAFQRWFSRIVLACARDQRYLQAGRLHQPSQRTATGLRKGCHDDRRSRHPPSCQNAFRHRARRAHPVQEGAWLRRCFSRNGLDPLTLSGKETLGYANELPTAAYRLMALAGTPDGRQAIDRDMAAVYLRIFAEKQEKPTDLDEAALKLFARRR